MKQYVCNYLVKYSDFKIKGNITVGTTTSKKATEMVKKVVFDLMFNHLGIKIEKYNIKIISMTNDFGYELQTIVKKFLRDTTY